MENLTLRQQVLQIILIRMKMQWRLHNYILDQEIVEITKIDTDKTFNTIIGFKDNLPLVPEEQISNNLNAVSLGVN